MNAIWLTEMMERSRGAFVVPLSGGIAVAHRPRRLKAELRTWGRRYFTVSCLGLLLALTVGCGPKLPPLGTVHGQVTLDGKPVPNADICFLAADGASSFGRTDAEGRYKLSYPLRKGKNAGAMIGKHRVTINTIRPNDGSLPEAKVAPVPIPPCYNAQTTLTAEVKPGENEVNFDLKSRR